MERALLFTLGGREYALRLAQVDGLCEPGPVRPVHDAPAGVTGLTEWRGRLVTVLDLAALLGAEGAEERASIVRLAPPLEHSALHVPAVMRLGWIEDEVAEAPRLLDPLALVTRTAADTGS